MITFLVRRFLLAIVTIWLISVASFVIIQLPPGDFVDTYIAQMAASGSQVSAEAANAMRQLYGLDRPMYVQYGKWIVRVVQGDFGESMEWRRPVMEVIGDRLWLTLLLSFAALIITWGLALPIGIY
jgi:peptide/nickel transport system permease protein